MSKVIKLSDIEANPVIRSETGFAELDWIYGKSKFPGAVQWGMPQGKISIWSGMAGTGKSRLSIAVAKNFAQRYGRNKVLYISTEAPLGDFAEWAGDTTDLSNFYCSSEEEIDKIIEAIYEVKPYLVFIDSVNAIKNFNGNEKSVTRLIKGANGKPGLKQVVHDIKGHIVLLGQLNQDGKTIKGGTSLPHMVDVALDIIPTSNTESSDQFIVKVGVKNRHGTKGVKTVFTHTDTGVVNTCEYRLKDKVWRKLHNIPNLVKKGIPYIGEDGKPTDVITPEMQARMDQSVLPTKVSTYDKIGIFLDRAING